MSDDPYREYAFLVAIKHVKNGAAECEVRIRMRDLSWFTVWRSAWPQGAPTPAQLELLTAAVADELHTHVLAVCGVQGVLLAETDG
jgi:hypothetical protein